MMLMPLCILSFCYSQVSYVMCAFFFCLISVDFKTDTDLSLHQNLLSLSPGLSLDSRDGDGPTT
jgi:hypothetical protein